MAITAAPPEIQTISVTCDGRRATLTLNRPNRLNALSNELMAEVADAAAWFDHQPDLRVVVVAGAGRSFCAGFDVDTFADTEAGIVERKYKITFFPKPLRHIHAVNIFHPGVAMKDGDTWT